MDKEFFDFRYRLMREGLDYEEGDLQYLFSVAKKCAKLGGVPMAGTGAVMMSGAGAVAIPGIGAVPGYVVGALAGFVGGTAVCTISKFSLKPQLDKLLEER